MNEGRPDPDALLALADRGRRGRLLVFIGAAPGVGKTYAMLQRARLLKQEGVDVVVGLVETHGRAETLALTRDLEIAFNAGTHLELIRMSCADFEKLVKPLVMSFSTRHSGPVDREPALVL